MKNNNLYLTTHQEWNLVAQIKTTKCNLISGSIVRIAPKNGKTGLNEEKGEWILKFWQKAIENNYSFEAHRLSWSEIFLFNRMMDFDKFQKTILNILLSLTTNDLKNLAIFVNISGNSEQKIKEIDRMYLQLIKIDYWQEHIYPSYYENGKEIKLNYI